MTKHPVFTNYGKKLRIYRRFQWLHCSPGGGLVLKGEASWRTVSGFLVNHQYQVMFRRRG